MSKPAPRSVAAPEATQKPADDAAPEAAPARTPTADAGADGGARATAALAEVLVRLLERDGPVIRAESSLRRLLVLALGRELGLPEAQQDALSLAALLGALGELGEGGAQGGPEAGRQLAITLQLLSGVALPATAREALAHQYERWDGGGLPSGLREEQIPFPARVLAVARAAAALLGERGPGAAAVVDELQRQAGSAFDPLVVSVLRRVFAQRERHGIGYGWGGRVAVAHPRELRALELAARLHGEGYAAETAGTAAALRDRLRAGAPQALVIGADLPDADAAALVREVRAMAAALPVLVVDAADARRRVELLGAGADVCFPPDADFLEVRATLDALLRRGEATFPRETPLQLLEEPRAADAGRPAAVRPIAVGAGQGA
jgi:DNA-binding NarL/FixJ family response regulator